jgi:sugar lactone lactonase YvrE
LLNLLIKVTISYRRARSGLPKDGPVKVSPKAPSLFFVIILLVLGTALIAQAAAPNLMAAFFVKGKVGLKWSSVDGAAEYLVYRQEQGGDFQKIGTTAEDRYFDTEVTPGATYIYKVAVVEGGTEVFSGEKSVTIPGDVGGFKAPTWVGIRMDQDKLFLNWDAVPGAMAYNVWRSETSGSGYENIGNAQGSRFVDKAGLVKGITYYYVLTAMNSEFDETPYSEEQSHKYGMSMEEQELAQSGPKIELIPYPMTSKFEITEALEGEAMNQPSDVFVNSQGLIYVTDTLNATVHCFDNTGKYKFSFGKKIEGAPTDFPNGGFLAPFTLFIDGKDQVFVSDIKRNDIQVFDAEGKFLRRIQVDTGADMNPLRANGLHVLDDGRMVMTDTGNHRFLVTTADGRITMAQGSKGVETGQFIFPDELTVTPDGRVFIVGPITCRIQEFKLDGTFVNTFGSVGESAGHFGRPKGIGLDEKGLLWVSDGMSHMMQGFTLEGEVKSALSTAEDDWQFTTPRGFYFTDVQLFVVQRLANKVAVYDVGP